MPAAAHGVDGDNVLIHVLIHVLIADGGPA